MAEGEMAIKEQGPPGDGASLPFLQFLLPIDQ
jgi:hypothetical protein